MRKVVVDNFIDFLGYHIAPYQRKDLPVSFIGSVAFHYQEQLREAAERLGYTIGTVYGSPLAALIRFHTRGME